MSDKELKLLIAGQCMASLLYKNTGHQMTGSVLPKNQRVKRQYEEIALKSWEAATELMALSKKEEKQEPREFVHIFRKGSSMSYPSWAENGMFRCVEISEEIE